MPQIEQGDFFAQQQRGRTCEARWWELVMYVTPSRECRQPCTVVQACSTQHCSAVALEPRTEDCIETEGQMSAFSRRDAPEVCISFTLFGEKRAQGKPGRRLHPRSCAEKRTSGPQVEPDHPGFPCAKGYGLYVVSPASPALLPPSPCGYQDACQARLSRMHLHSDLTPAWGRQDHTTSPSAPVSPRGLAGPRASRPVPVENSFKRRSSARRRIAHRKRKTRPAIPCVPDAVASIASHRAFVTCATPLARAGRPNLER